MVLHHQAPKSLVRTTILDRIGHTNRPLTSPNSLAGINFGLMLVGATQVTRITLYNNSLKKGGIKETIKDEATAEGQAIKDTAAVAKNAVK